MNRMSAVLVPLADPAACPAPPPVRVAARVVAGAVARTVTRAVNDDRRKAASPLRVGLIRTEGAWPWRDDPRLASLVDAVWDVAFHSLRRDELARAADAVPVTRPDLVITLDLAAARLALGLGCPVWLLAPCDHGRGPAPCADGIRVFSPLRPFDWRGPLARMAAELAAMALPRAPEGASGRMEDRVEDLLPGSDWFPTAT